MAAPPQARPRTGACPKTGALAGAGDHRPVLEDLARGIPGVELLGHVRSEDLGRYFRHALAALLPTVSYETFGMT